MTKNRDGKEENKGQPEKALSRRDFVRAGAAAGVSAAVLSTTSTARAEVAPADTKWNYEADVVIVGGGCTGLVAAIRARDLGASVIVVEQNFEPGGKMIHSGSQMSFGGSDDPALLRDIAGESDKEGFITVPRQEEIAALTDTDELLFMDHTDWTVVDPAGQAPYRYTERTMQHGYVQNTAATRSFLTDNYVRTARISGTHGNGGMSRARRAAAFLMLGDKTDIKAGTVTREDAGIEGVSSSHFAPRLMGDASNVVGPGAVNNGAALGRPLEFSAREKGVQFILNQHMDEVIREQPFAGKVLGVVASYSPRINPETNQRLESLYSNGNIDEQGEKIYIRAKKAVVLAAGGHGRNPEFRSMFNPAFREPGWTSSGWALLGDRGQDASGIMAGLRIGANLAGMQQNISYANTYHIPGTLATRDSYTDMLPGYPGFFLRGSTGIALGSDSFQHLIVVNQVGSRFFNDIDVINRYGGCAYPAAPSKGQPTKGLDFKAYDLANAASANVRNNFKENGGIYAATAINEGSAAPDFFSGPIWAVFDSASVERDGWNIDPPFTSPTNGYFFTADTIEELAAKIEKGHEFQRVPLKHLAETVEKWNSYVDSGGDPEFGRGADAPMYKIDKPPFYAASLTAVWHDSYGGLRINDKAQVIDMAGQPIPGLYSGGENSGGTNQHGLGKALVHGYMAGTGAAGEPA